MGALVLGLHYLNDAQLTLSSTAILVSMIDDGICNCDEYGCGEQYVYQWTVTNSTDCASVTFESYDSCHSRKDMQIEERKYNISNNVTWYHDDNCDDWIILTPKQNKRTGINAMIVSAIDCSTMCIGYCFNKMCCRDSKYSPCC